MGFYFLLNVAAIVVGVAAEEAANEFPLLQFYRSSSFGYLMVTKVSLKGISPKGAGVDICVCCPRLCSWGGDCEDTTDFFFQRGPNPHSSPRITQAH